MIPACFDGPWRCGVLIQLPWRRTIAVSIIAIALVLAIAVPAWCFGSGLW